MSAWRRWTEQEVLWLESLYADTSNEELGRLLDRPARAVGQKARNLGLRKNAEYMEGNGSRGRFRKHQTPWNKGRHYEAGGRSEQSQFKPGDRPKNWQPIGTEVVDSDGYLKRKVRDDAPVGESRFNWERVHVLLWEESHGPVPKGYVVAFRNGDKTDLRLDNLECIPRGVLSQRNTMWERYPRPVAEAIAMRGALRRRIREMEEAAREESD